MAKWDVELYHSDEMDNSTRFLPLSSIPTVHSMLAFSMVGREHVQVWSVLPVVLRDQILSPAEFPGWASSACKVAPPMVSTLPSQRSCPGCHHQGGPALLPAARTCIRFSLDCVKTILASAIFFLFFSPVDFIQSLHGGVRVMKWSFCWVWNR